MKIKTSELTGAALDWAVARCIANGTDKLRVNGGKVFIKNCDDLIPCEFSTDWAKGGPIIERELCELIKCQHGSNGPVFWEARAGFENEPGHAIQTGPTPLIAAMRCFVASKLGGEVEIPEELA